MEIKIECIDGKGINLSVLEQLSHQLLHLSIGFKKNSIGSLNSLGEFRSHIDEYVLE